MNAFSLVLLAFVAQALKIAPQVESKSPDRSLDLEQLDRLEDKDVFIWQHAIVHPELKPSDLEVMPERQLVGEMLFYGGCALAAVGIAVIYWDNGLIAVIAIIAYVMVLSCMSNSIRNVFIHNEFRFPQFLTSCHALCTCISVAIILKCREVNAGQKIVVPTVSTWIFKIAPVALCVAFSLGLSNLALLLTNTHFYEILSASNVLTCALVGLLFGNELNKKLLSPLCCITMVLPILALGEMKFSALGFLVVMVGNFLRGLKAQIQCLLMAPGKTVQTFDPLNLTCCTSVLTFAVMMAWSLLSEGLAPWNRFFDFGVLCSVGVTCIFAIILNTSGMFVMKEVGPVGAMIIGELKGVLACVGAVLAYGEVMTKQQLIAYPLVISGAVWYNRVSNQIKAEAAAKKTEETKLTGNLESGK